MAGMIADETFVPARELCVFSEMFFVYLRKKHLKIST